MSKARNTINEMDDARKERLAKQESIYAIHRKFYRHIEDAISTFESGLKSAVTELVGIEDDATIVFNSVTQLCSDLELQTKLLTKKMSKKKIKDLMGK